MIVDSSAIVAIVLREPGCEDLVAKLGAALAVVPFGEAHWGTAVDAYARFGKGRHAAGLNFGDCLSYATARLARQPLLCQGRDFAKTDLDLA